MIGIGTQDSLEAAQEFATSTGLQTPNLVWDETGATWVDYGVSSQPAWMVYNADGTRSDVQFGAIDEAAVKAALGV